MLKKKKLLKLIELKAFINKAFNLTIIFLILMVEQLCGNEWTIKQTGRKLGAF